MLTSGWFLSSDLALRCLLETPGLREPPQKRLKTSELAADRCSGPDPVLGLAVALCCHHRCEWRHYVGQEFFLQRGLGAVEFSAFCRMSSWATCGFRPDRSDRAAQVHLQEDLTSHEEGEEPKPAKQTDAVDG